MLSYDPYKREPKVGRWFTICCHIDLQEIEDETDVEGVVLDRNIGAHVRVWDTERQALEDLLNYADNEDVDAIIRRLR